MIKVIDIHVHMHMIQGGMIHDLTCYRAYILRHYSDMAVES